MGSEKFYQVGIHFEISKKISIISSGIFIIPQTNRQSIFGMSTPKLSISYPKLPVFPRDQF